MRTWAARWTWLCAGGAAIACGGTVARDGGDPHADAPDDDAGTEVGGTRSVDDSSGGLASGGSATTGGVSTIDARATRVYPEPCVGVATTRPSYDEACSGFALEGDWDRALYLLVDRTEAMATPLKGDDQSRLDGVIAGLDRFFRDYGSSGRFAEVQVFGSADQGCDPDDYPLPFATSRISPLTAAELIGYLRGVTPQESGRWTVPALLATLEQGVALAAEEWAIPPQVEVVLVTAGNPSRCTPEPQVEAIEAYREERVAEDAWAPLVHVVELGTGFDLTEIAEAGGTDKVFSIQEGDLATQLARVLYEIFWGGVSFPIEYQVPEPPDGVELALDSGRLFYGDYEVPRIEGLDDCTNSPHGGWWYTDHEDELRICECTATEVARAGGFEFALWCEPSATLPPP